MASSSYALCERFILRLAGLPWQELEAKATPETLRCARQFIACEDALKPAAQAALAALREDPGVLPPAKRDAVRNQLGKLRGVEEPVQRSAGLPALGRYGDAFAALQAAERALEDALQRELPAARTLSAEAWEAIRHLLVFAAGEVKESAELWTAPSGALPPRTTKVRQREQTALLYLQRLCAKNDTMSAFGPTGWGRIRPEVRGFVCDPDPELGHGQVFPEKWVALRLADAISADEEALPELMPRPHPMGRLQGSCFVREDTGQRIELGAERHTLLLRCDGRTPAHALHADDTLRELVAQGALLWRLDTILFDEHRTQALRTEVEAWRPGPAQARWLPRIRHLLDGAARFAQEPGAAQRQRIVTELEDALRSWGLTPPTGSRILYSGSNLLGEERYRECRAEMGQDVAERFLQDAAPWIGTFRDTFSYCAARVNQRLRALLTSAPGPEGREGPEVREGREGRADPIPLPAFLLHCERSGLSLTGNGITAAAADAYEDVKAAFARATADRSPDAREWELTPTDCEFVRRSFGIEPLEPFGVPAPDLQIVAADWDAVRRGDYEIMLGELHTGTSSIIHALFWACPDKSAFIDAFRKNTRGERVCYFGMQQGQDKTSHSHFHWHDVLPEQWTHVAATRVHPSWRSVPPGEAEVYLEPTHHDVRIRRADTREDLGSFTRSFGVQLGIHPFFFGYSGSHSGGHSGSHSGHMPRLRMGRVILQREMWILSHDELSGGPFHGTCARLVPAVERLRARRGLPRRIYIRPTAAALARRGVVGRDKDLKPIFIDLESYPFLELLHRWLQKHGEVEATEMLPTPEQTPWQEGTTRRLFELRTLVTLRDP